MWVGIVAWLLTMFGYWIGNLVMKIPISSVWVYKTLFWRCSIQLILISVFTLVYSRSHEFNVDTKYLRYAGGAATIWFLPFVTFLKSIDLGKVSIVVPISNSSLLFTALFSWLLLWETLDLTWWWMIVRIVMWLMLLWISFHDIRWSDIFTFSSGVPYAIFSSFGRWFTFVLFSMLVPKIWRVLMTLIISIVNFLCSFVLMKKHKQDFALPNRSYNKYILITAVWAVIWTASYNRWVGISPTNLVAAVGFTGPLVVVIWSYFLYQERLSIQQYIWILIVVSGVIWFGLTI